MHKKNKMLYNKLLRIGDISASFLSTDEDIKQPPRATYSRKKRVISHTIFSIMRNQSSSSEKKTRKKNK